MQSLKKARKLIENQSEKPSTVLLSQLILALESNTAFNLSHLYQLDHDDFLLAIDVIKDWRLDRYYTTKAVLLDLSMQIDQQSGQSAPGEPVAPKVPKEKLKA